MRMATVLLAGALAVGACAKEKERTEPAAKPTAGEPQRAPAPTIAPTQTTPPRMKPDLQRTFAEWLAAVQTKDIARAQTFYAPDATIGMIDNPMRQKSGLAGVAEFLSGFQTAFPDMKKEAQLTLVSGNQLVAVIHGTGTNSGPMMMMPATNRKVGVFGAIAMEFDEAGKIKTETHYVDEATIMGQLGMLPKGTPFRPLAEAGWPAGERRALVATDSREENENVAIARRMSEAFNAHDVPAVMAYFTDDVIMHDMAMPMDVSGKAELERSLKDYYQGFPDVRATSTFWAASDYVVEIAHMTGTNSGDMPSMKMKKTGKSVDLHSLSIWQLEGGKAKRFWTFSNGMAFLIQLGLVPEMKHEMPKGTEPRGL